MLRRANSFLGKFAAGDSVILRPVLRPDRVSLSKPLIPGKSWKTPFGKFEHDFFIGKPPRHAFVADDGNKYIISHPTYEDYVVNRTRGAQPIYPHDASAIVALADIHVDSWSDESTFHHFLEAGTGHGSLTLAICRAIHAAGQPNRAAVVTSESAADSRTAILHTVDRNPQHSNIAFENVRDFRRGMYLDDVKFYVEDSPIQFLQNHPEIDLLSGVFLDLPDADNYIGGIADKMRIDAPMLIFCPSVSQVQDVVHRIRADTLPLTLVNTVELLPGMGGSMRNWDVRTTTTRDTGELVKVCRPRVGDRVVGGGFVGILRRLPTTLS